MSVLPAAAARWRAVPVSAPVGVSGTNLTLNGSPHKYVGLTAYELGTVWGENAGCGGMETDAQLDQFFSSLPADSLVRIWAMQGTIGTNYQTHQLDWGPLTRVLNAAQAHHQHVILSLGGLGGVCDNDHWAQPGWYAGGFRDVNNDNGLAPMSYFNYVQAIVNQFKNNPAVAMWEPYAEAEASTCAPGFDGSACVNHITCPNETAAAQDLRYFFDTVGGKIEQLDPNHPVESGLLGGGQCGTAGTDWTYVNASPGINVASFQDYYGPGISLAGSGGNSEATLIAEAKSLNKPVLDSEIAIPAANLPGCTSLATRAADLLFKSAAQFDAGVAGVTFFNWELDTPTACSDNILPNDPALLTLQALELFYH